MSRSAASNLQARRKSIVSQLQESQIKENSSDFLVEIEKFSCLR